MNIGYVYGFNSYPPKNGGGVHVYNLIHNLLQLGAQIHTFEPEKNPGCRIYSRTDEGIEEFFNNIDVLYIRIDGSYLLDSGLKIKCMKQAMSVPVVWEVNSGVEEKIVMHQHINTEKSAVQAGAWIKNKIDNAQLRAKIKKENRCRVQYAKQVKAAICVSDENAEYAGNFLKIKKCKVVPNGSDPGLFSPGKSSGMFYGDYDDFFKVIYIGDSRYPWQGFRYVEELAERARENKSRLFFVLLDNSPDKSNIKKDNVLVMNQVDYSEVPAYVASADACLCLYHDFYWSPYGFNLSPLKLFDYMASGKPVIASRLGQIATIIEDGRDGLLTTNDITEIYEKLLFCYENRDKAEEMGRLARNKVVNHYNWGRAAGETIDVFKSLL